MFIWYVLSFDKANIYVLCTFSLYMFSRKYRKMFNLISQRKVEGKAHIFNTLSVILHTINHMYAAGHFADSKEFWRGYITSKLLSFSALVHRLVF
jgi:hypothetical protein